MHTNVAADKINQSLKETYGYITNDSPNFRLVWSNNELEHRFGEYVDMYNDVFLRAVKEVRRVPKYPHVKDKWVLEKRFPNNNPELPFVQFSYEPLFVFPQFDGTFEPPPYNVVQAFVHIYLFSEKLTYTNSDALAEYERELKKEQQVVFDYLDNETPDLAYALKYGKAVTVPEVKNVSNNHVDVSG